MDSDVAQIVLNNRRIAYVITDRNLRALQIGGLATALAVDQEVVGRGSSLFDLTPELLGCETVLGDVLNGKLPEYRLSLMNRRTADGQTMYLTMVSLPYRNSEGQITGLLHMVDDVTEIGVLQQQVIQNRNKLRLLQAELDRQNLDLAAANAELRRLDDMKSIFVAVAAHELRTPLAPIKGYVEMLLDGDFGPLNQEQKRSLDIVCSSADRLLAITNNLLDATRIETGRMEVLLQPTDLHSLIEAVIAEFSPELERKSQQLELRSASPLPLALCDKLRATQIIGNLLSNASKYTPSKGRIEVTLRLAEEEGYLQLSVADNGVGIPAEEQKRLFTRFFRAGTAHLTQASGSGLGLYITQALIKLHGGRIWLESAVQKGATFHVTLPIADLPTASSLADAPLAGWSSVADTETEYV